MNTRMPLHLHMHTGTYTHAMDGWMDGWMDGRVRLHICIYIYVHVVVVLGFHIHGKPNRHVRSRSVSQPGLALTQSRFRVFVLWHRGVGLV